MGQVNGFLLYLGDFNLIIMKRYVLFATAILAVLLMFSCKNNSKKSSGRKNLTEVQTQKQEVADSVLKLIDEFEAEFLKLSDDGMKLPELFVLTDAEKAIKPDYLLDPAQANLLVTRLQKINALAYYTVECGVRESYDMPLEEVKEAMTKLSAEVNFAIDMDHLKSNVSESEKIGRIYESCKENDDLTSFWQFQCALIFHTDYIIASNPDLYIPKISEEGLKQFNLRLEYVNDAATALAPYDSDMASLLKEIKEWDLLASESDWDEAFATESTTAQFYIANKQAIVERRNRMLSE